MRGRAGTAHSFSMPRPPRFVLPGFPHHVTQRGNYRQEIFFRDEDRRLYLDLVREFSLRYGVAIQAYCLMSNHVHLIAVPEQAHSLGRMLQRVHGEYARGVHLRLRRVGHLWQARFNSVPLDEPHFWAAMVYVEQNPVRARLVEHAWDWSWSSAQAHTKDCEEGWLDLARWRSQHTPGSWTRRLELGVADHAMLERIREATLHGRPLGDDSFLQQIERDFNIRPRRGKLGRPRKSAEGQLDSTACSGSVFLFGGEREIGN
jgi:putative transposase